MKRYNFTKELIIIVISIILTSCGNQSQKSKQVEEHHDEEENVVSLTKQQVSAIKLEIGHFKEMNLNSFISTNGVINVLPQEKVDISAIIGANVSSIKVIEGQYVKQGEVLAVIEHPGLIDIQVDFKTAFASLKYLDKELARQKTLSSNNISSGKELQQTESEYYSAKAKYDGLKSKLEIIGINPNDIINGEPIRYVSVKAPISGVVYKVSINIGKYVEPQSEMFEIVNTDKLYADLFIYENDLGKVKLGQDVVITHNNNKIDEHNGKVISIGKNFDDKTRAVTIKVKLNEISKELVPGVFVRGRIMIDSQTFTSVPNDAIVTEGDKSYIFVVDHDEHEKKEHEHEDEDEDSHEEESVVNLKMMEIIKGVSDRGYTEIRPLETLSKDAEIALNGAYYLLAEIKKGEAEHTH